MLRKIPMRKCLGCMESKQKKELIRIVKDSEGNISLDKTGKKNGRGAYFCNSLDCLEKLIKSKRLEKEFEMSISKEVYDKIREDFNS
jgi:predicted RNA-binding protein YlxR (DUF448 family)